MTGGSPERSSDGPPSTKTTTSDPTPLAAGGGGDGGDPPSHRETTGDATADVPDHPSSTHETMDVKYDASPPAVVRSLSGSRSRFAGKPHAYFASSEEESEAELDERDSHSSRDASNNKDSYNYGRVAGGLSRGSIGVRASHHSQLPTPMRAKTMVPPNNRDATTTTMMTRDTGGRVAVGLSAAGVQLDVAQVPPLVAPALRNKRVRRKHRHRHLPRGLPVFQDPRFCMWTSTHDANAPSEDRYSSLVNVLLRPPKIPQDGGGSGSKREKMGIGNNNNSNAASAGKNVGGTKRVGAGSKSGSSCVEGVASGEDEEASAPNAGNNSTANATSHANNLSRVRPSEDDPGHDEENNSLIRLSLWSVIDGHGGGCVATYAAEVLLPHIAASVARALKSDIVDRGVCNVNGQLRDANALDLDGLIRSSDRSRYVGKCQVRQREAGIDVVNPNSIHYRSPNEDSESEGDIGADHEEGITRGPRVDAGIRSESESEAESEAPVSVASSLLPGNPMWTHGKSVSSVKASLKTNLSSATQHGPVGTHSPAEVAALSRAVTDSFLAVDEGWINSIDPVTTHQTSCVSNGRWNAGACALVVFTVQRLDWRRFSSVDREPHHRKSGLSGFDDTSHNKDAARRRKLDRGKSIGSLSTLSSTSSITTEANITESLMVEAEHDDVSDIFDQRRRWRTMDHDMDFPHHQEGAFIGTPAGCDCHYYYPHDAMLYTAHVGDCRAVMLGSAPPRTIKVPPDGDSSLSLDHADISEDESCSETIADEISSSEHDSDSSGDMMEDDDHFVATGATGLSTRDLGFVRRKSKRQRRSEKSASEPPFVPLPPLNRLDSSSEESAVESDDSASTTSQEPIPLVFGRPPLDFNNLSEEEKMSETEDEDELIRSVRSGSPTQMDRLPSPTQLVADPVHPPPLPLSLLMRPIDLTTDHSAYNPAEVNAVLRRCNNAPKAISSASSGGIKRVAGSLAVTRALGDAYLKTPRLSFFPYKRHAPYITARPEVNCRVLTKGADRILTLASDGVWERASGDEVLRWVRNFYNSEIAWMKEKPMYDMEDEQLANEGEMLESGMSVGGGSTSGERSSEDDASTDQRKPTSLKTPTIVETGKTTSDDDAAVLVHVNDDKLGESDAISASQTLATKITANEATAPVKVLKRKHSAIAKHTDITSVDNYTSSHSGSTNSPRGRGVGVTKTASRRHRRSFSAPTVADVIVRKVLNKVRKTRNISTLSMLMSLPKGRARRSKHDDITAMVVDLSTHNTNG
ncbi:hypothetical protein ACHAW5_010988 [Stephanodiscus triporus]|uniref:PPM-type phosphatase domain-containing protein n=1 Tax=Stephanodiscus triporus TaxID=2934178 RepID=A0ABD3NPF2_9STRA